MNIKLNFILCLLTCTIFFACGDDDNNGETSMSLNIDCDIFKEALFDFDEDQLKSILDPELENFTFLDLDNNVCAHDVNLSEFASLLNMNCEGLTATKICCGCKESLPLLSVINIELDSVGFGVTRVLDLITINEDGVPLRFGNIN